MKLSLIFEDGKARVTIVPETDQEKALLVAFGMDHDAIAVTQVRKPQYGPVESVVMTLHPHIEAKLLEGLMADGRAR